MGCAQIQNPKYILYNTGLHCTALQFMGLIKRNAQADLALESLLIWDFGRKKESFYQLLLEEWLAAIWLDYSLFGGFFMSLEAMLDLDLFKIPAEGSNMACTKQV